MFPPSTTQRDLRAPIPARPSPRLAASTEHQATIARHLTVRDRWLARMLAEHRVLTSPQLVELAFPSRRAANLRLRQLYGWRVADRFQPYIGRGRAPMFYVLDTTGAHLLAHEDGVDPRDLKFRAERSVGIAHSLRLAHLHGVNSFFTGLIAHATTRPERSVTAWWSETRCTRHFGDLVRPDAYGRWREANREIEWFLEWDTGSYHLSRLVAKLPGYAKLATTTRITTPLLVCFANTRRETHTRRLLAEHLRSHSRPDELPVATTTTEHLQQGATPAADVWLPLHHTETGRYCLIDLRDAWPHLPDPTPNTDTTPHPEEANPDVRLNPPAPMPPWNPGDLTWKKAR